MRRRELLRIRLDPRDLRLLATTGLLRQPLLGSLERRAASLLGPQMLGQLITTVRAEQPVLPAIGLLRLLEDVGDEQVTGDPGHRVLLSVRVLSRRP
jgi:hypothetical protein